MILRYANLDYKLIEIDTLTGEHKSKGFLSEHPCGYVPVLIDGNSKIYAGILQQMMHLCRRFKQAGDRLALNKNFEETDKLFALFNSKFRPITIRISRIVFAPLIDKKQ